MDIKVTRAEGQLYVIGGARDGMKSYTFRVQPVETIEQARKVVAEAIRYDA